MKSKNIVIVSMINTYCVIAYYLVIFFLSLFFILAHTLAWKGNRLFLVNWDMHQ